MVIRFKKLHLHNFASYKDARLDLNDMGFTLVSGRNYCKLDNAYSNGSGKSSVFNGLCYALTGETTQGITNGFENIFSDPDDCWVKLTLEADDDEFIIQRIKTPKQNLRIWLNGDEISGKGIRESSKVLATHLPDLTTDLVNGIIILGQGLPRRFTNNKPSHRKELLENLTKSDFMIQSIKDKLESRMTDLRLHLREDEDALLENNSQLKVYEKQLTEYNSDLAIYDEYQTLDAISDKINTLNESISITELSIKKDQEQIETKQAEVKTLEADRYKNQTKLALVHNESEVVDCDTHLRGIENDLVELSAEIKTLKNDINKLESIVDICPTCGQKIPEVNKPSTKAERAKLGELLEESAQLQKKRDEWQIKRKDIVKEISKKYQETVSDLAKQIGEINLEISQLKGTISQNENNKSDYYMEIVKLANLKENFDKLTKNIKKTEKSINIINKTISKVNVDIALTKSRLDILQQMMTLAKREFRGILLSNVIEYINRKVKKYSMEVFGTDELSFKLNDNYIDITYCDKLYENLSGGEKQKIDVIVQLALRDILSRQLNVHFNVLVLDEIYDGLDTISCQKITNLISNLSDIDSIFVISHHVQDLEITYDNNLLVEKNEDGISTISFE